MRSVARAAAVRRRGPLRLLRGAGAAGRRARREGSYERSFTDGGRTGTLRVTLIRRGRSLFLSQEFPAWASSERLSARVGRLFDVDADPRAIGRVLSTRPAPRAARRAAAGPADAGSVGSVRDRRARDPRPAGLRARRADARGPARRASRAAGSRPRIRGGPHARLPDAAGARGGGPVAGRRSRASARPRSGRFARAVARRLVPPRGSARPRRPRGAALRPARDRAVDGSSRRAPRVRRRRRVPRGRPRPSPALEPAGVEPRDAAARAESWSPFRAYATLHLWASLADAKAAHMNKETERREILRKNEKRLSETRIDTPAGAIVLVAPRRAPRRTRLRGPLDGMSKDLARRFGDIRLRSRIRRPEVRPTALRRYLDGDLGALDALEVDTDGTPFQEKVWSRPAEDPGRRDAVLRAARARGRQAFRRPRGRGRERAESRLGRRAVPPRHRIGRKARRLRRRNSAKALAARARRGDPGVGSR